MPNTIQTKPLIDPITSIHDCALDTSPPETDVRSAPTEGSTITQLLVSPPSTQPQPNERFYCTVNETPETHQKSSELRTEPQPVEDEDSQEGLPPKQAAEVAAAARFISKVDIVVIDSSFDLLPHVYPRPRLGSTSSPRDSLLDTSLHVSKSRAYRAQMHLIPRRTKVIRPPPLDLDQTERPPEEVQSPLPQRISSKGAPSFHIGRAFEHPFVTSRNATSPSWEPGPRSPLPILTPESANTFHFDFSIPSEPRLSRSASGASEESQSPATPPARVSDDQLRRDIEAYALEQGLHLRGGQNRTRRPLDLEQPNERQSTETSASVAHISDDIEEPPVSPSPTKSTTTSHEDELLASPGSRRKKSMFGWLQKKPEVEVDDLIDLYLTDEQRQEVKTVKRKPSRGRLTRFRTRVMTDPLPGKVE